MSENFGGQILLQEDEKKIKNTKSFRKKKKNILIFLSILSILFLCFWIGMFYYNGVLKEFSYKVLGKKIVIKQVSLGEMFFDGTLDSYYDYEITQSRCKEEKIFPEGCDYIRLAINEFVDPNTPELQCWDCRYTVVDCYYACPKEYSEEMNLKIKEDKEIIKRFKGYLSNVPKHIENCCQNSTNALQAITGGGDSCVDFLGARATKGFGSSLPGNSTITQGGKLNANVNLEYNILKNCSDSDPTITVIATGLPFAQCNDTVITIKKSGIYTGAVPGFPDGC